MKISEVYYEELRSVCIDGIWTNKRIGAEVDLELTDSAPESLYFAKAFVRKELDKEIKIGDNMKYKKAFEKIKDSLQNEIDKIGEIPF